MAQEGTDWTSDLLDRLDHYIELVRSNTTDRLVKVARLLVYGLIAVIVGAMAGIVALIALIRILDVVLPREVWLPYVVLGAIFLTLGLFLWSKKTAPGVRATTGDV
ncbi:MAG: phage holin family protein [Acidimicrobiales bacterium]